MKRQPALSGVIEEETMDRKAQPASGKRQIPPLASRLREQLPVILENEPVQLAYLYGSHATGQTTPFSDVDVALLVGAELRPLDRLKLVLRVQLALADRCGIENADVRVIDEAPLVFRGRVVSDGTLVYARDDGMRVAFETATRSQYFDYLPIHRELQASFFQAVRDRGLNG